MQLRYPEAGKYFGGLLLLSRRSMLPSDSYDSYVRTYPRTDGGNTAALPPSTLNHVHDRFAWGLEGLRPSESAVVRMGIFIITKEREDNLGWQ
jgi:hypothetical protein